MNLIPSHQKEGTMHLCALRSFRLIAAVAGVAGTLPKLAFSLSLGLSPVL